MEAVVACAALVDFDAAGGVVEGGGYGGARGVVAVEVIVGEFEAPAVGAELPVAESRRGDGVVGARFCCGDRLRCVEAVVGDVGARRG